MPAISITGKISTIEFVTNIPPLLVNLQPLFVFPLWVRLLITACIIPGTNPSQPKELLFDHLNKETITDTGFTQLTLGVHSQITVYPAI